MLNVSKYFIAIVFESPLQEKITAIKKMVAETFNSKGALKSPAHITLQMPFEFNEQKIKKLNDDLSIYAKTQTGFTLLLKDFNYFEPRVVYIDVIESEPMLQLKNDLSQMLKIKHQIFDNDKQYRGFHPHVTIAFRDLKKPLFYEAKKHFTEQTFYAEYKCQSIALLKHNGQFWEVAEVYKFGSMTVSESGDK
jgi:2'-5' RNA ligase